MVGKVKLVSTGYNPDGPRIHDLTLGEPSGIFPAKMFPAQTSEPCVTLHPVGRRILVVPVDQDTIPNSVLHIEAGQLAKELRLCAVLAVGPKVVDTHAMLTPGVAVWLKPYFGTEIIVNGYSVLFIKPEDVSGVADFRK